MECEMWFDSINVVLNGASLWAIILLFADQRRIEKRYETLLHPPTG